MNPDISSTSGDPEPVPPEWSSTPHVAGSETPDGPPQRQVERAPQDVASILAFVFSLVGALLFALPLAVLGVRRTRAGARRGRGFAITAFALSAVWAVALVAVSASGLLGTSDPMAASELIEPAAPSVVTTPTSSTASPSTASPSTAPPSSSAAAKPLAKPKKVYWLNLKPGMCVKDSAEAAMNIPVVDCRAAHQLEVTARTKAPGPDRWPGDDKIGVLVEGKCRNAFERYVGISYDQSDLDMDFWTADEQGWADGNRTLICFVYDPTHDSTTETLAAAAR